MRKEQRHQLVAILLLFAIVVQTGCHQGESDSPDGPDVPSVPSVSAVRVLEFLPAPGQFVNEGYTCQTMADACRYAEERLAQSAYVSLGGFGGYIVVAFDHAVVNDGGYNLAIKGNAYSKNSEPGIVWVSQDTNGNGLADDAWYELQGSEYGKPETIQGYAVTYYRPSAPAQPVRWTDNRGNEGEIDYLSAYHRQDFYYPLWVEADSYTLTGTRLAARNADVSGQGTLWHNEDFPWGYADNFSPSDMFSERGGDNHFRIADAVKADGTPASLASIHFVKIQTATNTKSGWLGEQSTEVVAVRDYNMLKTTAEK